MITFGYVLHRPELDQEILEIGGLLAKFLRGVLHAAHIRVSGAGAQAERDFAEALQASDIVGGHRYLLAHWLTAFPLG